MSHPLISITNLSKKYKLSGEGNKSLTEVISPHSPKGKHRVPRETTEFWALKDISFDLNEGDVMGVIGKNGSGKSTLLKILSGIIKPSSGTVNVKGNITSILEIGMGFHPDLTGKENIFFYGSILGMKRSVIQSRLGAIIDFSGIEKFINAPIKHYSNGMYLRLALAIVLNSDIKILLLDEVLSVGDAEFQMRTTEKIQSVLGAGVTILMVSHSMNEVMQLCNRCVMLEQGQMTFNGKPSEVITNYMESSLKTNIQINELIHKAGTYEWAWADIQTAPGNEEIKLRKVSLQAKENRPGNKIFIEDDIEIEIQFWKLISGLTVQLSLLFHDMLGNPVFYAASVHNKSCESVYRKFEMETGIFSFHCQLDQKFLNHSSYSMQVRFGQETAGFVPNAELYIHKELFRFKILKNPALSYFDMNPAVLRPQFNWQYEKISSL